MPCHGVPAASSLIAVPPRVAPFPPSQVWRKRERAREERVKAAYKEKVKSLRRQHNMNTPGKEIRLLQEIRWLKQELVKVPDMPPP